MQLWRGFLFILVALVHGKVLKERSRRRRTSYRSVCKFMRRVSSIRLMKDSKGNYEVGQRMASDLINFCSD